MASPWGLQSSCAPGLRTVGVNNNVLIMCTKSKVCSICNRWAWRKDLLQGATVWVKMCALLLQQPWWKLGQDKKVKKLYLALAAAPPPVGVITHYMRRVNMAPRLISEVH